MLHLTYIHPFENLSQNLLQEINKVGKIKQYLKGSSAMSCDDTLKYFYIIISGKIKVFQYNPQNNKEQTIYLLSSSDMFDVLTVLDGTYHEVMTMALETSEVLELPITKVREWIETNPAFNKAFFPYMAKQMRQIEELATDLSLYDTSTRLMKLLLKDTLSNETSYKSKLLNKLSHEDIASLIGSVRHVVNRHLQQLKKDGIINIERKKIAVKNIKKLLEKVEKLI